MKIKKLRKELKKVERRIGNIEVCYEDDYGRLLPVEQVDPWYESATKGVTYVILTYAEEP